MSVFPLIVNQTAQQTVNNVRNVGSHANGGVNPHATPKSPAGSNTVSNYQAFQVTVASPIPGTSVSCSVQVVGSNDGWNWLAVGTAIAVSSTPDTGTAGATANAPYDFWSAYITAISGTGAVVNCLLSS